MDHQRTRLALIAGASLLGICVYSHWIGDHDDLPAYYARPEQFDNRLVDLNSAAKIVARTETSFTVAERGATIEVRATVPESAVGCYVYAIGIFHQEGWLEPHGVRIARGRRLKILISVAPALWVAGLVLWHFRFRWRPFGFDVRSDEPATQKART